jgi:methyl-accepting chemotaxis protein
VVASEVKSLADQTSGATAQIAAQIGEVQNATRAAVDIIAQIGRIVSDVDATTKQVADAVDAQGLATNEIAGHVEHAFTGFRGITENIHGVTENVSQTEGLAKTTSSASGELSVQARRLSSQVSEFLLALHRGPLDRRQGEDTSYKGKERRTRAA